MWTRREKKKAAICDNCPGTIFIHAGDTIANSQGEGFIPAGVEGGADGPGLLFGLILWVGGELEFNVGV